MVSEHRYSRRHQVSAVTTHATAATEAIIVMIANVTSANSFRTTLWRVLTPGGDRVEEPKARLLGIGRCRC